MRLLIVALILLAASAKAPAAPQQHTILVLGDSISAAYGINPKQGWVHRLQQRLTRNNYDYTVVNASISGETTGGGLARLTHALHRHKPAIVVVELGGNDALRGYPLARISDNLSRILSLCHQVGAKTLLLPMRIPPNYGLEYSEAFFALFQQLAQDLGVAITPFFLEGVGAVSQLMQDDGIHPKAIAQERLLDNMWPELKTLLSP